MELFQPWSLLWARGDTLTSPSLKQTFESGAISNGITMTRIPVGLQAVFLASNRGQEVHKPPPGNVASRVFSQFFGRKQRNPRRWFNGKKNSDQTAKASQNEKGKLRKQQKSQRSLESSHHHPGPVAEIFVEHDNAQQRRSQVSRKKSSRRHNSYEEDSTTSPATFMRSRTSGSNQSHRESFKKSVRDFSIFFFSLKSGVYRR